ncbi:MAG: M36 family metallopeptidase [Nocardioidaceae bacterium]
MSSTRSRGAWSALAVTAAAGLALTAVPTSNAASSDLPSRPRGDLSGPNATAKERAVNYDSRAGTTQDQAAAAAALVTDRGPGFASFAKGLGAQSVLDYDSVTGTPRNLTRLDGFLSGPSSASAASVAMDYVRAHLPALGLTSADLTTFRLRQDYVDIAGIHHVSWTQSVKGLPVFSNGLKANVTKNGELVSIQGAPVSGLAAKASKIAVAPHLSAAEARAAAATDVNGTVSEASHVASSSSTLTRWSNSDQAQLVWFMSANGLQLGWSTYVQAGGTLNYQHVIDAATGRVLYRHDTTNFDRGDALVYDNYPGAPVGGTQRVVNLYKSGYLPPTQQTWLRGNYVIAWSDTNDNNVADSWERSKVPGTPSGAEFELVPFRPYPGLCNDHFVCTWKPSTPFSWQTNRRADITQGFYYNSVYHDYLAKAPFGFTQRAGNFELSGGDPVLLNDLDGANTADGLPDGGHIDNANMSTPPDGIPPTMQMYLFHRPFTGPVVEPYLATSSTMDPSVILHEYTHGLSNRLVVDAQGNSTLNSIQAGAMGEAWSDYYAMDYLVTNGYVKDTAADGEVFEGSYLLANRSPFRTEAIDCSVQSSASGCTQINGELGGYTYGDFPTVGGVPEVHSSGEIWAQTLWQLRKALGHTHADAIITRAMSLAPADPTFLDMRNAIVQANLILENGNGSSMIWGTFAQRGMGWYAGTIDAGDSHPAENFKRPPSPETPRSTVYGRVKDQMTGKPLAHALVAITGHGSGFTGDYTAVTNDSGSYQIPDVYIGTYALVRVTAPGYEVITGPLEVDPGSTRANFSPRRDWAADSGGGAVTDFNGPDYSGYGCGPAAAIDLSQGTGWGSTTGNNAGDPTNTMIPKFVEVKLASRTDVTSFAVNPSNTCGDPGSSSTGKYKIETSPDGKAWTRVAKGEFTSEDRHLTRVPLDKPVPSVRYVKFWMLSPQVPDFHNACPEGSYGGCTYTDMTEIAVFGN